MWIDGAVCSILCPVNCIFVSICKATPTNSNLMRTKRTKGVTLGKLQCAMRWDRLPHFPSIVATQERVP